MLAKRKDINGDEYEYCDEHSNDAASILTGFARCELEDNPLCHPDRLACPAFVEYMTRRIDAPSYVRMLFPARRKNGDILYEATEGHPDPTGLVDKRMYAQRFADGIAVDEPYPMRDNQNLDGTSRFECTRCTDRNCNRCSWNKHCVCVPPCVLYTPEELAEIEADNEEDEWDEPEGPM